jgi:ATP-binding cassette subfamily B protein
MIMAGFLEVVSIGAIVPFFAVLIDPKLIYQHQTFQPLITWLNFSSSFQMIVPITFVFIISAIFAGIFRTFLLWRLSQFSMATCSDIGEKVYSNVLCQPYHVHISTNSSEVISGVLSKTDSVVYDTLLPLVQLISSLLIGILIFFGLMIIDPKTTIFAISSFGVIYCLVLLITKKQLFKTGLVINKSSVDLIKSVQEALGGIRDVILDRSQGIYLANYKQINIALRNAQAKKAFVSGAPRYIVESLGIVTMALLAYSFAFHSEKGMIEAMPFFGALAVAAQRLLPLFQQIYSSVSFIRTGSSNLLEILDLLDRKGMDEIPLIAYDDNNIQFNQSINLKNVAFKYGEESPWVLHSINLKITKGDRLGIIGKSGSGKSTFVDIIMGLLFPLNGSIFVDKVEVNTLNSSLWQKHIAHVPQFIFLSDSSIIENIAFGVPIDQIDIARVREVAKNAQLSDFIEALPEGYQTLVGERGVCLSGGQRQRIGIARALYKNADVIIFDEATSALDAETEDNVMKTIYGLSESLTILVIAHRLSTLRQCTKIIKLECGEVGWVGTYNELISSKPIK